MQEDSVQLTALPQYTATHGGVFLITFKRNNRLQIIEKINQFLIIHRIQFN